MAINSEWHKKHKMQQNDEQLSITKKPQRAPLLFNILSWVLFIAILLPVAFFSAYLAFFNGDSTIPRHDWGYLSIIVLYAGLFYLVRKFMKEQLLKGRKIIVPALFGVMIILLVLFVSFLLS